MNHSPSSPDPRRVINNDIPIKVSAMGHTIRRQLTSYNTVKLINCDNMSQIPFQKFKSRENSVSKTKKVTASHRYTKSSTNSFHLASVQNIMPIESFKLKKSQDRQSLNVLKQDSYRFLTKNEAESYHNINFANKSSEEKFKKNRADIQKYGHSLIQNDNHKNPVKSPSRPSSKMLQDAFLKDKSQTQNTRITKTRSTSRSTLNINANTIDGQFASPLRKYDESGFSSLIKINNGDDMKGMVSPTSEEASDFGFKSLLKDVSIYAKNCSKKKEVEVEKLWGEKMNINYSQKKLELLKKDWVMKKLKGSLENLNNMNGALQETTTKTKKNSALDQKGLKYDIESLINTVIDKMNHNLEIDAGKIPNKIEHFQDIMIDYTKFIKEASLCFQKSGLVFISQTFDTLWTFLMYMTDNLTSQFDKYLSKNYEEQYTNIENEQQNLRNQYQMNNKLFLQEKKDLKDQLKKTKDALKKERNLQQQVTSSNPSFYNQFDIPMKISDDIIDKPNDLGYDLQKQDANPDFPKSEKVNQTEFQYDAFNKTFGLSKNTDLYYSNKDQSTQTDLKFSKTEIKASQFNVPGYLDSINTICKNWTNPVINYLTKDKEILQNHAIIDSLPKLSNKVCYKFFKADNPINTIHTIMADLVSEFGYEQTKAIISNLHKLNENADTKDQFKLISRQMCFDSSQKSSMKLNPSEFYIIKSIFETLLYDFKCKKPSSEVNTMDIDFSKENISYELTSKIVILHQYFCKDTSHRKTLRRFFRKLQIDKVILGEVHICVENQKHVPFLKEICNCLGPDLEIVDVIKLLRDKFEQYQNKQGSNTLSNSQSLVSRKKIFEEIFVGLGNLEAQSYNFVLKSSNEHGFYYNDFIYHIIKPLFKNDWKQNFRVCYDSILLCVWDTLDTINDEWWTENKPNLIECIEKCDTNKQKKYFGDSSMDAQGSISIIYSVLPKYIKSQNDKKKSQNFEKKFFSETSNQVDSLNSIDDATLKISYKKAEKAFCEIRECLSIFYNYRNPAIKNILLETLESKIASKVKKNSKSSRHSSRRKVNLVKSSRLVVGNKLPEQDSTIKLNIKSDKTITVNTTNNITT